MGYGPHAVTTAGGYSTGMVYDANGNLTSLAGAINGPFGASRTLDWTSFNQLKKVTDGTGKNSEFFFGAGHDRVKQIRKSGTTLTDTTIYIGGLMEKVTTVSGNVVEFKHYIMAPTGRIAVLTYSTNNGTPQGDTLRYFHSDGLGSITAITDEKGAVVKRYAYAAWGKQIELPSGAAVTTNQKPTTRGFTDHEMLADHGLIHMNGRVYDPTSGRFISADPNVDGLSDAQGYNRYSYVGNNPLGATDPTGYLSLKGFLSFGLLGFAGDPVLHGLALSAAPFIIPATRPYAVQGAAIVVGAVVGYFFGPQAGAAAYGFVSGFGSSLINGGSIGDAFKSGIIGAVTSYATAWISGAVGNEFGPIGSKGHWNEIGRAFAHGAVGGAITEATGGEFRHGFYGSFAGSLAGSFAPEGMGIAGDRDFGKLVERTAFSAVVGGTTSVISGGKFANGAITAAFQHLFNAENTSEPRNYKIGIGTITDNDAAFDPIKGQNLKVDSGHTFAYLRNAEGEITATISFGPAVECTEKSNGKTLATGGGVPGDIAYPLHGENAYTKEWSITKSTYDRAMNHIVAARMGMGLGMGAPNYSATLNCTSYAINFVRNAGIDIPNGVGRIYRGSSSRQIATPYWLRHQLKLDEKTPLSTFSK